jgi:hypothetical protein
MQDFAALTMYKLAAGARSALPDAPTTTGGVPMYESQFLARTESYPERDRRAADVRSAHLFTSLAVSLAAALRAVARPFRTHPARPTVSRPGATAIPLTRR